MEGSSVFGAAQKRAHSTARVNVPSTKENIWNITESDTADDDPENDSDYENDTDGENTNEGQRKRQKIGGGHLKSSTSAKANKVPKSTDSVLTYQRLAVKCKALEKERNRLSKQVSSLQSQPADHLRGKDPTQSDSVIRGNHQRLANKVSMFVDKYALKEPLDNKSAAQKASDILIGQNAGFPYEILVKKKADIFSQLSFGPRIGAQAVIDCIINYEVLGKPFHFLYRRNTDLPNVHETTFELIMRKSSGETVESKLWIGNTIRMLYPEQNPNDKINQPIADDQFEDERLAYYDSLVSKCLDGEHALLGPFLKHNFAEHRHATAKSLRDIFCWAGKLSIQTLAQHMKLDIHGWKKLHTYGQVATGADHMEWHPYMKKHVGKMEATRKNVHLLARSELIYTRYDLRGVRGKVFTVQKAHGVYLADSMVEQPDTKSAAPSAVRTNESSTSIVQATSVREELCSATIQSDLDGLHDFGRRIGLQSGNKGCSTLPEYLDDKRGNINSLVADVSDDYAQQQRSATKHFPTANVVVISIPDDDDNESTGGDTALPEYETEQKQSQAAAEEPGATAGPNTGCCSLPTSIGPSRPMSYTGYDQKAKESHESVSRKSTTCQCVAAYAIRSEADMIDVPVSNGLPNFENLAHNNEAPSSDLRTAAPKFGEHISTSFASECSQPEKAFENGGLFQLPAWQQLPELPTNYDCLPSILPGLIDAAMRRNGEDDIQSTELPHASSDRETEQWRCHCK